MSYSDLALTLGRQSGETPATVQQFLDRLTAAGYSEADAVEAFQTTSLADLNTLLEKAEK